MSSPSSSDDRSEPVGDDFVSTRAANRAEDESPSATEAVGSESKNLAADDTTDIEAADLEQQASPRKKRSARSSRRHEIKSDLQFMISANRQAGGPGVYSGFRLVRAGGIELSPDEEPYLGAFLPLKVAIKFPRLLAFATLTYEDVFVNEQLDSKTRTVLRPGRFIRYGIVRFALSSFSLIKSVVITVGTLAVVAAIVYYGLKFKRIR